MFRFRFLSSILLTLLIAGTTLASADKAFAQTEYDTQAQEAAQQADTYRLQVEAQEKQAEPYKEAYEKKLAALEKLSQSSKLAHGQNDRLNTQISSLSYWLKAEDQRERVEEAELHNLDGWRSYWQSKKDSVLRSAAWNQEQIEQDAVAAQRRAAEEQANAARKTYFQSLTEAENSSNGGYGSGYGSGYGNGYGNGYGGYGRYGRGYGHSYGHSSGHSSSSGGGHFSTSGHR
ncbi:MAG: hypothetical protein KGS72_11720 [Cyanobacteria bacterium REEB67]|nr:hypothetical protein [Cyanobacteria bacterium REEB67]